MNKKADPKKISELMSELEQKVERLRDGEDDLEDSIKLYKEGMALAKQCEQRLKEARLEIEKIGVPDDIDLPADNSDKKKADPDDDLDI